MLEWLMGVAQQEVPPIFLKLKEMDKEIEEIFEAMRNDAPSTMINKVKK